MLTGVQFFLLYLITYAHDAQPEYAIKQWTFHPNLNFQQISSYEM